MRILWALLALATPALQGKLCDASGKCPAPYECVKTQRQKPSCEIVCHPSEKTKRAGCPEDQRCIQDGDKHICRPIDDGAFEP